VPCQPYSLGLTSPEKRVAFEQALDVVNGGGQSPAAAAAEEEEEEEEEEAPHRPTLSAPSSATALAALAALNAPPPGAQGGLFSPDWLAATSKTFDPHMGRVVVGLSLPGVTPVARTTSSCHQ
jgi:hypothetical protein